MPNNDNYNLELISIKYITKIGYTKSEIDENDNILGAQLIFKRNNIIFSSNVMIGKTICLTEITDDMFNHKGNIIKEQCMLYGKDGVNMGVIVLEDNSYAILEPNDYVIDSKKNLDLFISNINAICNIEPAIKIKRKISAR